MCNFTVNIIIYGQVVLGYSALRFKKFVYMFKIKKRKKVHE